MTHASDSDLAMKVAELQDALDHIRAVCETPQVMSMTIDLPYVARVARDALRGAPPWEKRPTRARDGVRF